MFIVLNWICRRTELQWGSSTLLTRLVAAKSQHLNATSPTGNEFWAWQYQSGFNTATPLYTSALQYSGVQCGVLSYASSKFMMLHWALSWKIEQFPIYTSFTKAHYCCCYCFCHVLIMLCSSVWANKSHIFRIHLLCTTRTRHPRGIPKLRLRGSID